MFNILPAICVVLIITSLVLDPILHPITPKEIHREKMKECVCVIEDKE
jgi:hypothetical protein